MTCRGLDVHHAFHVSGSAGLKIEFPRICLRWEKFLFYSSVESINPDEGGLVKFERVGLLRREVKVIGFYLFTICLKSLLYKTMQYLKWTQHWQRNKNYFRFARQNYAKLALFTELFRSGRFLFQFFLLPIHCSFVDKTMREEDQVKKLEIELNPWPSRVSYSCYYTVSTLVLHLTAKRRWQKYL